MVLIKEECEVMLLFFMIVVDDGIFGGEGR